MHPLHQGGEDHQGALRDTPHQDADDEGSVSGRPLRGRTVVVTRPRHQAPPLCEALRALGAEPVEFPTIAIRPPADRGPLREALRSLDRYDWAVLTSANGVRSLLAVLGEQGREPREAFAGVAVAAIGPSTAEDLRAAGVEVPLVPDEYRAERLVEALRSAARLEGARVLLARAREARDVLARELRGAGARVDEVAAYRTELADPDVGLLADRLGAGEIDWLTFTASSTVRNFVRLVDRDPGSARVAAIGPVTAGTAEELGMDVDVVAEEYTVPGLVEVLVEAEKALAGRRP